MWQSTRRAEHFPGLRAGSYDPGKPLLRFLFGEEAYLASN